MTGWDIYWLTRLSHLQNLFAAGAIVAVVITVVYAVVGLASLDLCDENKGLTKAAKRGCIRAGIACVVLALLASLTPSTEEAAAAVVLPKIANSQTAQELGQEAVDAAKAWLHHLKEQATDEKEKK